MDRKRVQSVLFKRQPLAITDGDIDRSSNSSERQPADPKTGSEKRMTAKAASFGVWRL
jgi:hypothetical protein